jgi:signal transduction histidine kinase
LKTHKAERVLIVAPVGDDASAISALLGAEGFVTRVGQGIEDCSRRVIAASGALLLTEEALESPHLPDLFQVLREQPAWSELPLIILASGGESRRASLLDLAAAAAGTITLLERPISTRTLVRSVQVALRSRRRQYEVRDLFAKLKSLNRSLERRVAERTAQAVDRAEKLRRLSAELSLAEERERRRIAQVLHDDLQQLLIAARMSFFAHCKANSPAKRGTLAQAVNEALEKSFDLTRSLSAELAPPVLYEDGLAAALEWLTNQTAGRYDIKVTVKADSSADPEAIDVRVFLFQAVRELLLNSVKHAPRSPIHVAMTNDGRSKVRIVVTDQGTGFDLAKLDSKTMGTAGFGLFSIRERITSIGGEFRIQSTQGRGTQAILLVPCKSSVPDKANRRRLGARDSRGRTARYFGDAMGNLTRPVGT